MPSRRYLRQSLHNRISDEIRRASRFAPTHALSEDVASQLPSPLDLALGHEAIHSYESALRKMRPEDRRLIIARVEQGQTYAEIAASIGGVSPNSVRNGVSRALVRLAEAIARGSE